MITSIIAEQIRSNDFSLLHFYDRRIRRIFPPLIAVYLFCSIGALVLLLPRDLIRFGDSLTASAFFLSNHHFFDQSGYFDTAAHMKPLLHSWSLAVEEQYYLLWPLGLLALWRLKSARWRLMVIAALAAASLIAAEALIGVEQNSAAFYLLPPRAWELLLGAALALTIADLRVGAAAANGLAALGLGLIAIAVVGLSPQSHFPGATALLPCLGAAFLIAAGYRHTPVLTRLYVNGPVVGLGLISYSLYLWHWPLFSFWRLSQERAPTLIEVCGLIVLSLCLAVLSYRWIEQPFRKGWVGMPQRRTISIGIGCMALCAALGSLADGQRGFPARFNDEVREILTIAGKKKKALPCGWAASLDKGDPDCVLGVPQTPLTPRVLLAGDSHAEHYAPPLDDLLKKQGMSGHLLNRGSCPPIPDVSLLPYPWSDALRCTQFSAEISQALAAHHFDIFVVAVRWETYTENEWSAPPGDIPDPSLASQSERLTPQIEASRRAIETAMRALIETLREKGTRVVLLGQVPPFMTDPVGCVAKARRQHRPDSVCSIPAEAIRQRLHYSNDMIRRLAKDYPTVEAFIASDVMCDQTSCSPFLDGVFIYRNVDHLNLEGSRRWSPYLATVPAFSSPSTQDRQKAATGSLLP